MKLLSGDPPRSWLLTTTLVVIVVTLALAPFLFPGAKPLNVAAKICVFALLVASCAGAAQRSDRSAADLESELAVLKKRAAMLEKRNALIEGDALVV